ncbi:MAG: PssD/Cps14F family polysaccharide biosynthesis glycosyltransferase [Planctomycetota bacterium]
MSEPSPPPARRPKVALVCSSGGHLYEMLQLRSFWSRCDALWVTFPTSDAKSLLAEEHVTWAAYPTNRNLPNLLRNALRAVSFLWRERPDAVVSTGAGVAVPFIVVAKFLGIRTVYVESIARIEELSLSGRIVKPFVDEFLVQWPELVRASKRAVFRGQVL